MSDFVIIQDNGVVIAHARSVLGVDSVEFLGHLVTSQVVSTLEQSRSNSTVFITSIPEAVT